MSKIDEKKVNALILKLSLKYNKPLEEIRDIVESQFIFAHSKMKDVDFDSIKNEEDLNNAKTNFLFKYLGRIFVSESSINRYNKKVWKK